MVVVDVGGRNGRGRCVAVVGVDGWCGRGQCVVVVVVDVGGCGGCRRLRWTWAVVADVWHGTVISCILSEKTLISLRKGKTK